MKFNLSIEGDLGLMLRSEAAQGKGAVTRAIVAAGNTMKAKWREQVVAAGLGVRLSNTVRLNTYPKGRNSFGAAALLFSKAPELMYAHDSGATIKSQNGVWLAIPTPAAGRGAGGKRITPDEWKKRRGLPLRFVDRPGRTALLVADGRQNSKGLGVASKSKTGRGRATVVIFILTPQVKLRKRLNIASLAEQVAGGIPALVVANWKGD